MTRHTPWIAAGVYQPVHQRRAYGHRRTTDTRLLDRYQRCVGDVLTADRVAPGFAQTVAVAMPRGGVRWFVLCPGCGARVTRLYGTLGQTDHHDAPGPAGQQGNFYACRTCWGLRYHSQYEGRRPEASPDRLAHLLETSHTAKSQRARDRRHARYVAASDVAYHRGDTTIPRRETALALALMILLARAVKRENRQWARHIVPALLRCDAETRRHCAAMNDTPAWAKHILEASLLAPQHDNDTANISGPNEQNLPDGAEQTAENDTLPTLIVQERIDELRAIYTALGQPRCHSKAA